MTSCAPGATVGGMGSDLRELLVGALPATGAELAELAKNRIGVSRQAVHAQLSRMAKEGLILATGEGKVRHYALAETELLREELLLQGAAEDRIWLKSVAPRLPPGLPPRAKDILFYAFTEMMNNAIDHSGGTRCVVSFRINAREISFQIEDDGVGIFAKVAAACGLDDERFAILELAKGKFTTARQFHSGEGIFFTSRAVDRFCLVSGKNSLVSEGGEDFLFEGRSAEGQGTLVRGAIHLNTPRTLESVFAKYSSEEGGFERTKVPVSLAIVGEENLISRSQAKRLLARFDRFREVILDFHGVNTIGQAFADEVFRVFPGVHPEVLITAVRAGPMILRMIRHVQSAMEAT